MSVNDSQINAANISTRQSYPWFSSFFAVILVLYFAVKDHVIPQLPITVPDYVFTQQFQQTLLTFVMLSIVFDVQRFMRNRRRIRQCTQKLKGELDSVWQSKKQLQQKAHVYSGHADKLKLFISDKLLEYIEYDEKFLHFKSIAAEVRHNGIISYDVVKTALQQALANDQQQGVDQSTNPYKNALDAMRYLWDLLDLSTADNIALHIGNHLIECEEHYYHAMLNQSQENEQTASIPYQPIFSADLAAFNVIKSLLDNPQSEPVFSINENAESHFEDDRFRVALASQQMLLGNENHIRLIVENVLKNAQHFFNKTPYKQKSDRISL